MSVQAVTWALAQKTGSPSAKVVLLALANYAGAKGEAFPSQERLADETEQSVDSVQRRLKELVAGGLIWKTGRYSNGANGGRRSNEYILLHDDAACARAVELGWSGAPSQAEESDEGIGQNSDAADCGVTYAADCGLSGEVKPQIEPPLNRNCAVSHIKLEPKPRTQTLPPTPQGGIGEGSALRFEAFEAVWPFDPLDSKAQARKAFEALGDEERTAAVKWARRFVEMHEERRRKLCLARTYLEEKRFAQFNIALGKAGVPSVVVWEASPQAAAWARYKRDVEGVSAGLLFFSEKRAPNGRMRKYRLMPSEWPPSAKDLAAASVEAQRDGPPGAKA